MKHDRTLDAHSKLIASGTIRNCTVTAARKRTGGSGSGYIVLFVEGFSHEIFLPKQLYLKYVAAMPYMDESVVKFIKPEDRIMNWLLGKAISIGVEVLEYDSGTRNELRMWIYSVKESCRDPSIA